MPDDEITPRLQLEHENVERTLARSERVALRSVSADLRTYEVAFDVRTPIRDSFGAIRITEVVVPVIFDLAPEHPMVAPVVFAAPIGVWNPHVHNPFGAALERAQPPLPPLCFFCLGTASPQQRLGELIAAAYYALAFARVTLDNALNPEASSWALAQPPGVLPTDPRPFSIVRGGSRA